MMAERRSKRRWGWWVLIAVVLLALSGATTETLLEDNDQFCTVCHARPEVTYVDRAQAALAAKASDLKALSQQYVAIDLASQHFIVGDNMNCIACHGGRRDLADRTESLALGLKDTVTFWSGQANQTLEKVSAGDPALIDRACVRCHITTLLTAGFDNHFHVKLPQTWALIASGLAPSVPPGATFALTDPRAKPELLTTSVTCLNCHQAHQSNLELTGYLNQNAVVLPACAQCHRESGKGPVGIAPPPR